MRRATAAVLLLAAATAAPRKRKLSLPRLGSIATKTGRAVPDEPAFVESAARHKVEIRELGRARRALVA